jgi:6-phosphofructokinase
VETDPDALAAGLRAAYTRGKAHALVAEGACNNAAALARHFVAHHNMRGFDPRVITLGHVQLSILSNRSGNPQLRISTSSYPWR